MMWTSCIAWACKKAPQNRVRKLAWSLRSGFFAQFGFRNRKSDTSFFGSPPTGTRTTTFVKCLSRTWRAWPKAAADFRARDFTAAANLGAVVAKTVAQIEPQRSEGISFIRAVAGEPNKLSQTQPIPKTTAQMARLWFQLACAAAAYAFLQPTTQKATARRAIQVQAVADLLPDDVVNSLSAEQLAALYNAPDAVAGAAGGVSEFITTKVGPALGAEAAALGELAGKASEAFSTKVVPALKEGGDALIGLSAATAPPAYARTPGPTPP